MKRFFITSALIISLATSVMANGNKVYGFTGANAFSKAFPEATNVTVKTVDQLTKISFTSGNQNMEVYYSTEGEMVAQSRHIKLSELPAGSSETISKEYGGWTITEAIEFTDEADNSVHYYVGLGINNKSMILEVNKNGEISTFKKK
ncbi:hypothetical protein [Foetidibacter luteolus]|uniref:hypothetical protein n=1 Tax=Foetidibacter luteolus TaxID=2608880 RepID=UPI00129BA9AA|nr:hypothetical protein [Foetidibacter luteolus]